ncbi:MAG: hypothetical protein IJR42_01230 [Paludibacteraceae bacterium]|nr:hypothetical protein [Paludibacteraceae bacterium]
MDKERATYTKSTPDNLVQIVGGIKYAGIAMLAIRLNAFADGDEARVSIQMLCEIFSCSVNTIKEYARRLAMLDIWHLKTFHGRGDVAVWKKGSNFDAYTTIKPSNFDAFVTIENHQTLTKKPSNFDGNNIDNNIAAERADKRAHAAEKNAAADGELEKGSPRQGKEDKMIQQQFEEFWTLFDAKDEYQDRKERCERVWYNATSQERREAYIKALRAGKKHRDNPLHYLQYDTPEEAKAEFPIFVNGDGSIAMALNEAENGGRPLAFVRGGLQLHINDNFAYIYVTDAIAQKIRVIRTIPSRAIEHVPAELRENQQ